MRETVRSLENVFGQICQEAYPFEWDENHITFLLMRQLRTLFQHRVIYFDDWSKIVNWQSFKNRGKQETNYGDIALIVNVQFSSGEYLKGVANLEAKRDSGRDNNFEVIDLDQIERIHGNLPYSHLLLYRHGIETLQTKFPDEATWQSHFWVSPLNTAKEMFGQISARDNWKILRTSFPFTMFLTSRIFWGFDLDFRKEIIYDIEQGINRLVNPSYLGVVNVYYENQQPLRGFVQPDIWEEL